MNEQLSRPKTLAQETLNDSIVQGIQDKKGLDIVILDLRKIQDAVTDYFIICNGESTTQVRAIAESISDKTKEIAEERPWHREGMQNLEWVILDYVNTVVHVFMPEKRTLYNLEELWSDADQQGIRPTHT